MRKISIISIQGYQLSLFINNLLTFFLNKKFNCYRPDTELEMEYDEIYISFFTCTMPVQNIWTKEDQRKNINKRSFLLVEEEEVLYSKQN